MLELGSNKV